MDYVVIVCTPATDYELEYRLAWTTETCATTRTLTVNAWKANGNMEDVLVQVLDSTEVTYTTRITVTQSTDTATQTYALTTDEWDSGDPNIRMLGSTESGDSAQGRFNMDYVVISCASAADYELEYRTNWTTETCADTRILTVNSWRANAQMENVEIQVLDSTEVTWTTRITVTATADGTTQTYTLTADEWDLGDISVRFLGTTESGDADQGSFNIDYNVIQCTPATDYEMEYRVTWVEAPPPTCDTYRLRVEAYHTDTEDILLQVEDGSDTPTFVTRITITSTSDPNAYQTYNLLAAEWDSGEVHVRFIGNTESGDTTQTDLFIDDLEVFCIVLDWDLDIEYDWSGLPATGTTWTLIVVCRRTPFQADPENTLIQVLTPPSTWNTRYTCNTDAYFTYNSYALNTAEVSGGSIRFIDAVPSDNTQSEWDIDLIVIEREYTPFDDTGGKGWDPWKVVDLKCVYAPFDVTCDAKLLPNIAGVNFVQTRWYADGEWLGLGEVIDEGSSRWHRLTFPKHTLWYETVNVTVGVYFSNGANATMSLDVAVDNSWLGKLIIALVVVTVVILIIIAAVRRSKKGKKREPQTKRNWRLELYENDEKKQQQRR